MLILFLWLALTVANPVKHAKNYLYNRAGSSQDDFFVSSLPGLFKNFPLNEVPVMFAGQLELYPENNTHYFFWSFEDQHKSPQAENTTIFWFNGGPGCSSMDGALMEAGPIRINEKEQVVYNDGSWHKLAKTVFVDQPAGTGFSYSDEYDHELLDVLWHFLKFLEKYLDLFPNERSNDFILAGESYAGQYIPYIANGILENRPDLSLRGLLIGNGFIDPYTQGLSFLPFAVETGILSLDHPAWKPVLEQHTKCQKQIDKARASPESTVLVDLATRVCDAVLDRLLKHTTNFDGPKDQQCVNMYDVALRDSFPSCGMNWPPDLKYVTPFLHQDRVMENLNLVNKYPWKECTGRVGTNLRARHSRPSIELFPLLLEKTDIVLFHGNRDLICNYKGAEFLTNALTWNGQKGFSESLPSYSWVHNGSESGSIRSERNLTYVNVFDASHMVPFDKPHVSRAIIDLLYKRFDYADVDTDHPKILTRAFGYSATPADDQEHASESSSSSLVESALASAPVNETMPADGSEQLHKSNKVVRLIQLAVIVIVIWSACAVYSTYRTRPTSIIKTKPSSGRKKNVQWADMLPELEDEEQGDNKESILSRAMLKFKRGDQRGKYAPTNQYEDIEMDTTEADDFIIANDNEENGTQHH